MRNRGGRNPVWIPEGAPALFPDPEDFESVGLIAGGGDLSPGRLLCAYRSGIFPWYDDAPILWWSPDPRAIIDRQSLRVSRSLRRTLRQERFRVSFNEAPELVLEGCAERKEGTWLTSEMKRAYLELFAQGHLVTYEVWQDRTLAGGLYGVLLDGLYAAESKFHRVRDASKVALACSVVHLFQSGIQLYDVQFRTEHLSRHGVYEISRREYLGRLRQALGSPVTPCRPSGPAPMDLLPWVAEHLDRHP